MTPRLNAAIFLVVCIIGAMRQVPEFAISVRSEQVIGQFASAQLDCSISVRWGIRGSPGGVRF